MERNRQRPLIRDLLGRLPEAALSDVERDLKQRFSRLPEVDILHLIYQQEVYEGQAKDYEFSGTSMRDHWESGYRDTQRTLHHKDWLRMKTPVTHGGIAVHDVHRADQEDMR